MQKDAESYLELEPELKADPGRVVEFERRAVDDGEVDLARLSISLHDERVPLLPAVHVFAGSLLLVRPRLLRRPPLEHKVLAWVRGRRIPLAVAACKVAGGRGIWLRVGGEEVAVGRVAVGDVVDGKVAALPLLRTGLVVVVNGKDKLKGISIG